MGGVSMKFFLFLAFAHSSLFGHLVEIGGLQVEVEIADTEEAWLKGLMFRKHLPEGSGMLFVYPKPSILSFWMKNTLIPLSIAFFDEEKKLLNIEDMPILKKGETPRTFVSISPAKYALEAPLGWFAKHKIKPGMKFSLLDQEK